MVTSFKVNDILARGVALREARRYEELVCCLTPLVQEIPDGVDSVLGREAWPALWLLGGAFVRLGLGQEANGVFERWRRVARVAHDPSRSPEQVDEVICSLYGKGLAQALKKREWERAVRLVDGFAALVEHDGEIEAAKPGLLNSLVNGKAVALVKLGRPLEADVALTQNIERLRSVADPRVHRSLARAMYMKAERFVSLGKQEQALEMLDELDELFEQTVDPKVMEILADAARGRDMLAAAEAGDEGALRSSVMAGSGEPSRGERDDRDVEGVRDNADALRRDGHRVRALELLDGLLANRRDQTGIETARAMGDKAAILDDLRRYEDAYAVDQEIVTMLQTIEGVDAKDLLARAWLHTGRMLYSLQRPDDALEALDRGVEDARANAVDADTGGPLLRTAIAMKAEMLIWVGRPKEAIDAVEPMLQEAGPSGRRDEELVALGLALKGAALVNAGDYEAAAEVSRRLINEFDNSAVEHIRFQVAIGLHNLTMALTRLGDENGAENAWRELLDRFDVEILEVLEQQAESLREQRDDAARQLLASVLGARARVLAQTDDPRAASSALEDLESRFAASGDPLIEEMISDTQAVVRRDK